MIFNKLNIGLIIILAILGGSVFLFEANNSSETLTSLNPKNIVQIKIESTDKKPIIILKENSRWRIVKQEISTYANEEIINKILALSQTDSIRSFPAISAELFKYQLDNPKLILSLNNLEIKFGHIQPLNNQRYLQIDDTIHLIKDDFYRLLLNDQEYFIE